MVGDIQSRDGKIGNLFLQCMDGCFLYLDTLDAIAGLGVSRFGFPVMDEGSGTACPAL